MLAALVIALRAIPVGLGYARLQRRFSQRARLIAGGAIIIWIVGLSVASSIIDTTSGLRLGLLERLGLLIVAAFAIFALFGWIALTPKLIQTWTGAKPEALHWLGVNLPMDASLFRACLILALFSGISFAAFDAVRQPVPFAIPWVDRRGNAAHGVGQQLDDPLIGAARRERR